MDETEFAALVREIEAARAGGYHRAHREAVARLMAVATSEQWARFSERDAAALAPAHGARSEREEPPDQPGRLPDPAPR